jgi:hypothetical protein
MPLPASQALFCTKTDGYRGIWWGQSPTGDEFAYKYSGGLATYPVQHRPFAIYAPAVRKTFFVWGGTTSAGHNRRPVQDSRWSFGPGSLLHMISYYDHDRKTVPRPTVIFDKWTADPHDNPVLAIDAAGYLWVFSPSHGNDTTPSFVHRSVEPYSIERFETVSESLFAYPQPWWTSRHGLAFFHTRYAEANGLGVGRGIYLQTSRDGRAWSNPLQIAHLEHGNYQVSAAHEDVWGTAFDYHPKVGGLDARTNLYYVETRDGGDTWQTAAGSCVHLPVRDVAHAACVRDFAHEGRLCYIKDLAYDHELRPVILFVTARDWRPGPQAGPHELQVARWDGAAWRFHYICACDSNYDSGTLNVRSAGSWRVWATSGIGPQPFNTGGEIELWLSPDSGATWERRCPTTQHSLLNHSHPRAVVNAHPEFAALWADGHAREPSRCRLYFSDVEGRAWQLPSSMTGEDEAPTRCFAPNTL